MTEKHKKYIAAGGIALFVLLSAAICWFVGRPLVSFVSEPERFRAWVDTHGVWGRLAFVGMMVLQVFVAIIPGEPLEIGAGYAFGALEGTLLCIVGTTLGGALVFWFVRRFGIKAVEVFISREKIQSLHFLQNSRRVYGFVILAFLLPGTPKDVLSYCAGLTPIRFRHWLLITSLCRIPSVITSTIGGDALGAGQLRTALWVFAATICVSLTGLLIYKRICRAKEEQEHGNHQAD